MNCGFCSEFCPFDAIKMDHQFELSNYERKNTHVYNLQDLLVSTEYYAQTHPRAWAKELQVKEEEEKKKKAKEAAAAIAAKKKAEEAAKAATAAAENPAVPVVSGSEKPSGPAAKPRPELQSGVLQYRAHKASGCSSSVTAPKPAAAPAAEPKPPADPKKEDPSS